MYLALSGILYINFDCYQLSKSNEKDDITEKEAKTKGWMMNR